MTHPSIPSHRFEEHSLHYAGTRTKQPMPKSNVTRAREDAMQEIYALAKEKNIPLDVVITRILGNSTGDLFGYVTSKGETPLSDPTALALQAVLLRAQDVATVANTLDISDEDALQVLENSLQDAIDTNSSDKDSAPAISAQAAIACALQFMSDQAAEKNLPTSMSGITKSIQQGASTFRSIKAAANKGNGFDLSDLADIVPTDGSNDPATEAAVPDLTPVSVSSQLASIPGASVDTSSLASLSPASMFPSISTTASDLPQAGGSSTTSGGVLNSIASIFGSVSNIANQVTQTASTVNATTRAVSGLGSNIGATSIQQYVKNNSGTISLIVILIVIVIVAAILHKK